MKASRSSGSVIRCIADGGGAAIFLFWVKGGGGGAAIFLFRAKGGGAAMVTMVYMVGSGSGQLERRNIYT